MIDFNICAFGSDSYKVSHYPLYPEDAEIVYSYGEARTGGFFDEVTFFGLQYIISRYLTGQVVTRDKIEEAATVSAAHFGSDAIFNRAGWEYILERYDGRLPVKIMALPEGITVPNGTCLFTIENTGGKRTAWLTNYLETLLMQVWSPTTVATSSREVAKIIQYYLKETGTPEDLAFKLHDFGYRGVSSMETAALAGAAHLTSFMGTDTMAALALLGQYYDEPMAGFSIPATEHSIMTARGPEGESDVVRQVLKTYPTGLVAMVIDSYDTVGFIRNIIGQPDIKEQVVNREGTVVFRPDSGVPHEICVEVFNELARVFGCETNSKGYAVLPPQVRIIQGDGISWERDKSVANGPFSPYRKHTTQYILGAFQANQISADNIAFGSGGGLLQAWDRDTQRFAIKCSAMYRGGKWHDVYKQPKTDSTKGSKRGRLAVVKNLADITTIRQEDLKDTDSNLLQVVFEDGQLTNRQSLTQIRERTSL